MPAPETFGNLRVRRSPGGRGRPGIKGQSLTFFVAAVLLWHTPAWAQQLPTAQAVHFLEQATFGPTTADVAAVQSMGVVPWLDAQMQLPESQMPDGLDSNQVRSQLFLNMANGPDQVRQRMIFALSQIIVVSANKNNNGEELVPWVRLLLAQRLRQLPHAAARGDAQPDDGQVPRPGLQPQGVRRRRRRTRTTRAS